MEIYEPDDRTFKGKQNLLNGQHCFFFSTADWDPDLSLYLWASGCVPGAIQQFY